MKHHDVSERAHPLHRVRRDPVGLRDRRGGTLAVVAVSIIALLAVMALCIDLAMAYTARGESQRVADSSALAGASAFIDFQDSATAVNAARDRLYEYATQNVVRNDLVDSTQVEYQILYDQRKVRVWISRTGLGTWFARFLGIPSVNVRAMAAAEASPFNNQVTAPQCVLPFTAPDLWDENTPGSDDGDDVPEPGEEWTFNPAEGDVYYPYDPTRPAEYGTYANEEGTGYGSLWRNDVVRDYGRQMYIKTAPPGQGGQGSGDGGGEMDDMVGPGNFTIWRMPNPDNNCEPQAGAEWVHINVTQCNSCPIELGESYPKETQPGNVASVKDSLQSVIDRDPDAYWDESCLGGAGCIKGSNTADPSLSDQENHLRAVENSPRVKIVAVYGPDQYLQGMTDNVVFNNFMKVFLDGGGLQPPDFAIYVRYIGPVAGSGGEDPGAGGSLNLVLRLVE